ncbi:hypothetical protein VPH35_041133 [Triticum aestivum]|uniref:Uncharacterized protein n=1 Tax=Aegilops tauschii TaxID=37682 RepID=M8BV41_AEGTA
MVLLQIQTGVFLLQIQDPVHHGNAGRCRRQAEKLMVSLQMWLVCCYKIPMYLVKLEAGNLMSEELNVDIPKKMYILTHVDALACEKWSKFRYGRYYKSSKKDAQVW